MKKAVLFGSSTLLLLALFALTSLASAAPRTLAPSGPIAPGAMNSRLFVFNPDTTGPATVNVRVLRQDGSQAFSNTYTIAANGALAISLGALGNNFQGSALVSSDKDVQAVVTDSNSGQTARDLYEGSGAPNTTLTLPLVRHLAANTQNSIIAAQNTGSAAASITAHFYNQSGAEVSTQTSSNVSSLASVYFNTNSIFPSSTFVGSVKITSTQNVAAAEQTLYLKDTASFRGLAAADNATTLFVNVVGRKLNKNSVVTRWTETYVRNNGSAPTDITVDYFSASGSPVTSRTVSNVPAEGSAQFLTNDASFSGSFNGWARVSSTGQPVSVYSLDAQARGNRLFGVNGVPSTQTGPKFVCGDTLNTATQISRINLLNTGASATATARIELYDPSTGAKLATKDVSLAPNSSAAVPLSASEFAAAGTSYEGLALVTSIGTSAPPLVVSVSTPYLVNGKPASITSYNCIRLP